MATYYARIRATLEGSTNSTYANADAHVTEQVTTYTEGAVGYRLDATTGPAATFTFSNIANPKALIIENLGTTAGTTVTAAWQNKAASAQSQIIPIAAEGVALLLVPDVLASANLTLTSSAGTIPCRISVIG